MYLRCSSNFGVVDPSEWVIDFHRTKHGTYIPNWNPLHHASWKQPFKADTTWSLTNQPTKNHKINQTSKSQTKKIRRTKNCQPWIIHKNTEKKSTNPTVGGHDTTMMTEANQGKDRTSHFFEEIFSEGGGDPKSEMCMYIFQKLIRILRDDFERNEFTILYPFWIHGMGWFTY